MLTGGLGRDTLIGGLGADRFDFNTLTELGDTATTRDTVTDFRRIQGDKIDLSTLDSNTAAASDQAFILLTSSATAFSASTSFTAARQLYYDQTARVLYGNVDADAAPEFSLNLTGVTSMALTDFIA